MTALVERAAPLHAPVLAAIHQAAFPPDECWSSDVMALHLGVPGAFGLLDPRGGMILARVAADEAEVVTLAVHPASRRQGLGEGLLRAAQDHARQNGARAMFLEVDVENTVAQRLYARLGFTEVGRRPHYYASGTDALVLRADL
jgi:ribosomal-protein-alanine N-acetyltransferase